MQLLSDLDLFRNILFRNQLWPSHFLAPEKPRGHLPSEDYQEWHVLMAFLDRAQRQFHLFFPFTAISSQTPPDMRCPVNHTPLSRVRLHGRLRGGLSPSPHLRRDERLLAPAATPPQPHGTLWVGRGLVRGHTLPFPQSQSHSPIAESTFLLKFRKRLF